MNTVLLNTVHLDGAPIVKKGSGGGGVTINNQSKSVDITENGTTEVRYDAGYTGLEKVSVNVNVNVVSDNDIAETDAEVCRVFFNAGLCANETYITKKEAARITDSDMVSFAHNSAIQTFNGFKYFTSLTKIPQSCFNSSNIESIIIPENVTTIETYCFQGCGKLESVIIPEKMTFIGGGCFSYCYKLKSITCMGVTAPSLGSEAFGDLYNYAGSRNDIGVNKLYVPANAIGYEEGDWLDPLQNPDKCGFTIKYQGEINNQDKSIDIVENGTTEIVADTGYTGLGKVTINTNVASSGGGGSDIPVIGDGKTYLYIKIAEKGRMNVPLYFSQTVAKGVTIDWGDGSATQTLSGTGSRSTTHTYADVGEYVISLNPADGCTLEFGYGYANYCVIGNSESSGIVYCNMLYAVEIGKNVTNLGKYAFNNCKCLRSVFIPKSVTNIGEYAFYHCHSLSSVVIPDSVTSISKDAFNDCATLASVFIPKSVTNIGSGAFSYCRSLVNIVIPESITNIGSSAFSYCAGIAYYDFRNLKSVPTLSSTSCFKYMSGDCKIVVPDSLFDTWKSATNWSTYASNIVKASEFNG